MRKTHTAPGLASFGQTPVGPLCPLPEDILLHLPGTRLWKLRNNLNFPGNHKSADSAHILCPLDYILAFNLLAWLDSDERLGPLAPVGIWDGDDSYLEDVGVRGEHGLESHGRDVLATWRIGSLVTRPSASFSARG